MNNLTELVINYQKTKNKNVLEEIFKLLQKIIKEKSKYIFYVHTFKYGESKFKLVDLKSIELCDIEQELYLDTLKMINRYNPKKPFENYLFAYLWKWTPRFITTIKFLKSLKTQSIYQINEEGEEENIIDNFEVNEPRGNIESNLIIEDIFNQCKNEKEKNICQLLMCNPTMSQEEIGKEMGMTSQNISLILNKLRKRLKKYLQE